LSLADSRSIVVALRSPIQVGYSTWRNAGSKHYAGRRRSDACLWRNCDLPADTTNGAPETLNGRQYVKSAMFNAGTCITNTVSLTQGGKGDTWHVIFFGVFSG